MGDGRAPVSQTRLILMDHGGQAPQHAHVDCGEPGCLKSDRIEQSASRSDEDLAAEFTARGWSIGPTRCPLHNTPKEP